MKHRVQAIYTPPTGPVVYRVFLIETEDPMAAHTEAAQRLYAQLPGGKPAKGSQTFTTRDVP